MRKRIQGPWHLPLWVYFLLAAVLMVNVFYIKARLQTPVDGIGSKGIGNQCVIATIRYGSPAWTAKLQTGDIILKIGNEQVPGANHFYLLGIYNSGDQVVYQVERNGKLLTFPVTLKSFWSQHPLFYYFLYFIILFVCFTSIYILRKKPDDRSARIFVLYLLLFAIAQNTRFLFLKETYAAIANVAFILSFNLMGVVLLNFHLLFPDQSRVKNYLRSILNVLYGAGFLIGLTLSLVLVLRNKGIEFASPFEFRVLSILSIRWMGFTLVLALTVAMYRYLTIHSTLVRKQLQLIITGSVFGLLTPLLFSVYPAFVWHLEQEHHLLAILEFTNAAGSYIMITMICIAIFRYKIWEIESFFKTVVSYGIVTFIILLLYYSILYIIDLSAINQSRPLHFIILAISVSSFLLLRERVQMAVDRFFHREVYDSASVVTHFEESLAGIYQADKLEAAICQCLDSILHVSFISLYRKTGEKLYQKVYCTANSDHKAKEENSIEADDHLEHQLKKTTVYSVEELQISTAKKVKIRGELLVPLTRDKETFGFFLMGHKLSSKSYSMQDIRLLTLLSKRVIALFHTAALHLINIEKQLMIEHERMRIAEDMHDEVGATLTRISILSNLAERQADVAPHIARSLNQISGSAYRAIEEMNQIIWALNSKNDSLQGLMAYIRHFIIEFLEPTTILCHIKYPESIPPLKLSIETRRNLYLVTREAVQNVVKHAGATAFEYSLEISQHEFMIKMTDNGKGFDPGSNTTGGNGLRNMAKRMADTKATFTLNSSPGHGTEIILNIPCLWNGLAENTTT